jgi:hypothetical protein
MRLVLTFLMAMSAVAVLVLGAAPASAMTGQGGCHEAAAMDHGSGRESSAGMDAHVMHCCVACTPQTVLPVAAPAALDGQTRVVLAPTDRLGRAPGPDPDPPRV